jgi:hypothetical protein
MAMNRLQVFKSGAVLAALALGACAQMPESVAALDWHDHWGDRGSQVRARDYEQCARLLENLRAQIPGCMARRGWSTGN